jgi:hypothetical protein
MPNAYPTAEQYQQIFRIADYWLSKKQRALLTTLLRAPNYSMTGTEIARALGYPSHSTVNLLFGSLGSTVGKKLKLKVPDDKADATMLVTFDRNGLEQHWRWTMRPELVITLSSLGWK